MTRLIILMSCWLRRSQLTGINKNNGQPQIRLVQTLCGGGGDQGTSTQFQITKMNENP